jgi:flavin-dependent dehydrogenase
MFVTDANLLPSRAKARLPLWWKQQVQGTSHIRSRVARYGRSADPLVRCARSQRLDRFVGIGWIAVGDAAMAFDPLSSRGIGKAVEQGHLAADAIGAHLSGDRDITVACAWATTAWKAVGRAPNSGDGGKR